MWSVQQPLLEQARRIRMPCASHAERAHAREKTVHMCMQAMSTEDIVVHAIVCNPIRQAQPPAGSERCASDRDRCVQGHSERVSSSERSLVSGG